MVSGGIALERPPHVQGIKNVRSSLEVSDWIYRPLKVIKNSSLCRRHKRLISFYKQRALGLLKPKTATRYKVTYEKNAPPFEVVVVSAESEPSYEVIYGKDVAPYVINREKKYFNGYNWISEKEYLEIQERMKKAREKTLELERKPKEDTVFLKDLLEKLLGVSILDVNSLFCEIRKFRKTGSIPRSVYDMLSGAARFKHVITWKIDGKWEEITTTNPFAFYYLLNEEGARFEAGTTVLRPEHDSYYYRFPVRVITDRLAGGNPGKKRNPRRYKKKTRRPRKMNTVRQEGSINVMQPKDKTYPAAVRFNGSLTSDASGVVSARFSIRNPTLAFNGSGTYNDILNFAALFDEYKPVKWTMQYIPLFAVGSTPGGSLVMCTDYDSDDTDPVPNYSNITQYKEYKILDSRKPFEFVARIPVLTEGIYAPQGADPEPATIHRGGFLDYNRPPNEGHVYLAGLGFPALSTICTFVLTLVVINRRQR